MTPRERTKRYGGERKRVDSAGAYGYVRQAVSAGVAPGEMVRLTVVWLPAGSEVGNGTTFRLSIRDLSGKAVASRAVTVKPGTGAFLDYQPTSGKHEDVWAYVRLEYSDVQDPRYAAVVAGLELVEIESGRTRLAFPVGLG